MKKIMVILGLFPCFLGGCGRGGGDGEHVAFGGYVLLADGTPVEGIKMILHWEHQFGDLEVVDFTGEIGWYEGEFEISDYLTLTINQDDLNYDFSPAGYRFNAISSSRYDLDFLATTKIGQ